MSSSSRCLPAAWVAVASIVTAMAGGGVASADDEAAAGLPHRPEGRLPGWLLEVQATRVEPCAGAGCLDVGLRLLLAPGDPAARRGSTADGVRRPGPRSCPAGGRLVALTVGDARPAPERVGLSRRYRLDEGALVRGRRLFGDRLPLVTEAVRRRLTALRQETRAGPLVAAVAAQLALLEGAPHYRVRRGVVIPARVEQRLVELARAFYQRRRRRLLVTSGTRSPRLQAEAMYTKLRSGGRTRGLYRKWRAARGIERAYRRGRARRRSREAVIGAMTAEINVQVGQGVYVSPHLQAGAVDLRSRGLRRRDRRTLLRLARGYPWICQIKLERRPPHFHLRFAGTDGNCEPDDRDLPVAQPRRR